MTEPKIKIDTNGMTPGQLIMAEIIREIFDGNNSTKWNTDVTVENIENAWDCLNDDDWLQDSISEFRSSGVETGLDCDWSRHYESKSVARQLQSGTWVGWTYWFGGGKYGEPDAIEWIDCAYFVDCASEEKMVVVRTFTKVADVLASASENPGENDDK